MSACKRFVMLVLMSLPLSLGCSSGGTGVDTCDGLAMLENDTEGQLILAASQEHTPTLAEKKAAALLWGVAVLVQDESAIDPFVLEVPFDALLADTPTQYPSLFPSSSLCTRTASLTQMLIAKPADFACGNSCVPDPSLLAKTGKTLLDKVTDKLVARLKQLGKYSQYTQRVRDLMAEIKRLRRALEQEYAVANRVYTKGQQIIDLLDSVDQVMSEEAADVQLSDVLDVVGSFAELAGANTVGAAVLAFQIGWEIGSVARLTIDCNLWKESNCESNWNGEGTFVATTTMSGDCQWQLDITAAVTLSNFSGSGTPSDPYGGEVDVSGIFVATLLSGEHCIPGEVSFDGFTGTVGGTAGKVVIAGTFPVTPMIFTLDFPEGVWDGTQITGPMTIDIEAAEGLDHPFTGTLVLASP